MYGVPDLMFQILICRYLSRLQGVFDSYQLTFQLFCKRDWIECCFYPLLYATLDQVALRASVSIVQI